MAKSGSPNLVPYPVAAVGRFFELLRAADPDGAFVRSAEKRGHVVYVPEDLAVLARKSLLPKGAKAAGPECPACPPETD